MPFERPNEEPHTYSNVANCVSPVDYDLIIRDLKKLVHPESVPPVPYVGPTDQQWSNMFYRIAVWCSDNGSSSNTHAGHQAFDTGVNNLASPLQFNEVFAIWKSRSTIRRVCMLYARMVWNWHLTNRPPLNWEKKGFRYTERFAAFDFFDGVFVDHFNPPVPLLREPTSDEIAAAKINAHVAIVRSRESGNDLYSTSAQVTGGRGSSSGARFNLPYHMGPVQNP